MIGLLCAMVDDDNKDKVRFLYDNYHKYVLSVARKLLKKSGDKNFKLDSEDVVQNVYIKLTMYIKTVDFNSGASKMTTYLYAVTKNEVNTFLKKEDREVATEMSESIPDDDFFEALCLRERYEQTVEMIRALDDEIKIPMIMKYGFEKTAGEIAELVGVTERQVYYLIEKGKRAIIEKIGKEGETDD